MTTVLIVDDEPNLVEHLERVLRDAWPELDSVAKAYNGREALAQASARQPDVIFLDIRMPGLNGIQVAEQLADKVLIVFITAYDEYAVSAFENAAADYLLKPISLDRLTLAVQRVKKRLAEKSKPDHDYAELLQTLAAGRENYLQWLRAGLGDVTELIAVTDVVYFKADQKYTSIVTPDKEYLVRISIKELEQQLDPNKFWRIHRGIIVAVADIASAKRDLRGRYQLTLRRRPESLRSSQSYGHVFKQM